MHTVYVALGSNVGDRLQNLRDAIGQLAPEVKIIAESTIYETEPWGYEEQDDFLNMVVQGETELEPDELLAHLKHIEDNVGRTKTFRNGPREIDLDILFYDDLILENEGLIIPHPRLHERAFVLVPLADIDPELGHPVLGKKISELVEKVNPSEIFPFYQPKILNPNEAITGIKNIAIGNYWAWAYSDLLSNTNRGVFAEFIVGSLLDVISEPRVEWDDFDLSYRDKKIEVKSSAYLQSWRQKKNSKIIFDIAKKRSLDAKSNQYDTEASRSADCYVFCVYTETKHNQTHLLNLAYWDFYPLSTEYIEQIFKNQKSVSLSVLQKHAQEVKFAELKSKVDKILGFER